MNLFEPSREQIAQSPLLEITHASVLRGESLILNDLNLRIEAGQHTGILGPNGSGKSTFIKLISREVYPLHGGNVEIFGHRHWHVQELRSLLGIVSPTMHAEFTVEHEALEVFEAVASGFFAARGLWWIHEVTDDIRERSHQALEKMGAAHLVGREMRTLSTGEARRVLIARALAHRPRALLLDEPCTGLDPSTRKQLLESLRAIAGDGTTLLIVTHHIEELLPEITHLVMLREGRVLYEGEKERLLETHRISELFQAPISVERRGLWYRAHVD